MEDIYKITIFLERKPTSVLAHVAGFHADPLSWSHWNLDMLGFVEGGRNHQQLVNFHLYTCGHQKDHRFS